MSLAVTAPVLTDIMSKTPTHSLMSGKSMVCIPVDTDAHPHTKHRRVESLKTYATNTKRTLIQRMDRTVSAQGRYVRFLLHPASGLLDALAFSPSIHLLVHPGESQTPRSPHQPTRTPFLPAETADELPPTHTQQHL